MIKISIITVTYNAAQCIQRTLDSIISQQYPCVEHLIVDGASTDNTVAMAEKYKKQSDIAENGHIVNIISEPDKGLYDAMNKGLRLATGEYIIYMNAGDFFPDENVLDRIISEASATPQPAVIYGDTDIVDDNGEYIGSRHLLPPENLSWKSFRYGMLVCHQAFYAHIDIAKKHEYNLRYRHSADIDWCIRVMKDAENRQQPLVNVHSTIAYYTKEGQTTKYHCASLWERFVIMRLHYGLLTTICMHLWFVVRSLIRPFSR